MRREPLTLVVVVVSTPSAVHTQVAVSSAVQSCLLVWCSQKWRVSVEPRVRPRNHRETAARSQTHERKLSITELAGFKPLNADNAHAGTSRMTSGTYSTMHAGRSQCKFCTDELCRAAVACNIPKKLSTLFCRMSRNRGKGKQKII